MNIMNKLRLIKHADGDYRFMQKDYCFYKGNTAFTKNQQRTELKNVYDTIIFSLITSKSSGFHLFRSNKEAMTEIQDMHTSGVLSSTKNGYVWNHSVTYYFYCGYIDDEFAFVMCDQTHRLGYMKKECAYVESLMYSSVLCAFWLWMQQKRERSEDIVSDDALFQKAMGMKS